MPANRSFPPVSAASLLRRAKTDALLISHLPNIQYLTGLQLTAGFVLVRRGVFTLFVDARYSENARVQLQKSVRVLDSVQLKPALERCTICGIESEHVTLQQFSKWKSIFKNTKFVQTTGVVAEARRTKTARELREVRGACSITRAVLGQVPSLLVPGVSERELAWQLADACHRMGATGMAFDTIVAFGAHTARPHHRPTDAVLRKGDIVQIDMGASLHGYCSDFSRVFLGSKVTAEQRRVFTILSRVQRTMVRRVRAGVTNRQLDAQARELLQQQGGFGATDFPHALGHGVGLDVHDGIVLSGKAPETALRSGEVVTIEPGLYFPGRFGMRIEDTVIVR